MATETAELTVKWLLRGSEYTVYPSIARDDAGLTTEGDFEVRPSTHIFINILEGMTEWM